MHNKSKFDLKMLKHCKFNITSKRYIEHKPNVDKETLSSILRVDQSGEIAANSIYKGQLLVFKNDPEMSPLLKHMWDQEKVHLDTFNQLIPKYRARPSLLLPIWKTCGYVLGVSTALLGKKAAMACTEAVETCIGNHYNEQLSQLSGLKVKDLLLEETVKKFRDEELEHLDIAVENDSKKVIQPNLGTVV